MDVDSLSPTQRDALAQLQALTNGGDAEVAIGVLSSVDWDVQVCALASLVVVLRGDHFARTRVAMAVSQLLPRTRLCL